MELTRISADDIRPAPYNPRRDLRPDDPAYITLRASLAEFGTVEPLVWNRRTGNLVSGHQRYKILRADGATEFDVSVVDMGPERERSLNLAMNKVGGDWDTERLHALLNELADLPDFDFTPTGFDASDLASLADVLANPLFRPDDEPTIATRTVTTEDVARVAGRMDVTTVNNVTEVTCPHCGESFGLSS